MNAPARRSKTLAGVFLLIVCASLALPACEPEKEPEKKETMRDRLESTDPAKRRDGLDEAEKKYGK